MIKKIIIKGNLLNGSYSEFSSGSSLYFYPSQESLTKIKFYREIELKRIKILSQDYELEIVKEVKWKVNSSLDCEVHLIYSDSVFIFDKFLEVKNDHLNPFRSLKSNFSFSLKNILILIFLKWLFFNFYHFFLVDFPLLSLDFIKNQPIGIKQNTVINEFLSLICHTIIFIQEQLLKDCRFFLIIIHKDKYLLLLSVFIISLLYKTVVDRIVDIAELFNNKTYNNLKERYDTIKLSLDQIIMCVLFFSISILILPSLFFYFLIHILFYASIRGLEALELGLLLLFLDTKNCFYFDKTSCEFKEISFKMKCGFIGEFLVNQCLKMKEIKKIFRGVL
ncbi:hypothetical protein NBO_64g0052 [Nosema bombycis CQ1]|uniref:Phosphatidylinositol N-acetylglucosaminyltransferase subunit Q n=1 Tax=Nosema bombycis (strain CQ1 / CVCC 102059) TaxID=578461 RepID=R0KSC3_NOSB1|nr:hypothetical protein NBO_64g0052 [Nosema bombycis CQ1]|eukprot:EOB13671.1 hypothetical protein NBO_64g0052 [Nosema bombycis CQ1]